MISGVQMRRPPTEATARRLRAGLAALALALAASPAAAFDLAELMALLARRSQGEARFSEQRFVQGLDAPLAASGTLAFAAPDRLERRTLVPRAEAFAVEGNRLTMSRGGRSRSVALDSMPELVAVVEALRGTLTGNAALLQRHFRTSLGGAADAWTLQLVPIDARLAEQVQALRVAGSRGELRSVEMRLAGGDRSLMTIEPLPAGSRVEPPQPLAAMPAQRP